MGMKEALEAALFFKHFCRSPLGLPDLGNSLKLSDIRITRLQPALKPIYGL